ncbi:MAG TPA: nuclear transport factor 2 family protein [Armatimonadota bacterium]
MSEQLEANKGIVRDFYNLAVNGQQPEAAVAQYLGPTYRQHNPSAADGPEPLIAFMRDLITRYPMVHIDCKRQVAEGDLVVIHSQLIREPGDRGTAVVDIFRLEHGKLVEHWDVMQEVPASSANDNTMF